MTEKSRTEEGNDGFQTAGKGPLSGLCPLTATLVLFALGSCQLRKPVTYPINDSERVTLLPGSTCKGEDREKWKNCRIEMTWEESIPRGEASMSPAAEERQIHLSGLCDEVGRFSGSRTWGQKFVGSSDYREGTEQIVDGLLHGTMEFKFMQSESVEFTINYDNGLAHGTLISKRNGKVDFTKKYEQGISERSFDDRDHLSPEEVAVIVEDARSQVSKYPLLCSEFKKQMPPGVGVFEKAKRGEKLEGGACGWSPNFGLFDDNSCI